MNAVDVDFSEILLESNLEILLIELKNIPDSKRNN